MVRPWLQGAEMHRSGRGGWLRAAVLGADDGVVSTASLMLGVAAASASTHGQTVLVSCVAGLVAGAMSMAAGEYVSVSSQRDAERADIGREKGELASNPEDELGELVENLSEARAGRRAREEGRRAALGGRPAGHAHA